MKHALCLELTGGWIMCFLAIGTLIGLQEFDNIEEINIQILDNNVLMKDIKSGRYENAIRKIESIIAGD